jgi:hypothetical protein
VEYALSHPALGREFRKYLKGLDVNAPEFKEEAGFMMQKPVQDTEERATAGRRGALRGNGNGVGRQTNGSGARTHGAGTGTRRRPRATI